MHIGITLLYSVLEVKNLVGVLKSYVVKCQDKTSVIDIAQKKAEEQINLFYPNYTYIGIEDVFTVTGEVVEGELMGRSTLYDVDSVSKAKKLVNNIDYVNETKSNSEYYCANLVYFYEGNEEGEG